MNTAFQLAERTKWQGSKVLAATLPIDEVRSNLPTFSRAPFGDGENINQSLEVIIRDPYLDDRRSIPVAAVSKRYALIQHTDLVGQVVDGLSGLDLTVSAKDSANVLLSEYGERFQCAVHFKGLGFDPGDGHPISLRLFVQNSVDGSCAFEISLRWYRQICSNGMARLTQEDSLREIHHLDRIGVLALRNFVSNRLPSTLKQAAIFKEWCAQGVPPSALREWINEKVRKEWGPHAAARVLHICSTGYDGRVGNAKAGKKARPDELFVSSDQAVPGAVVPAASLYHVYQAVTWIATQRPSVEEREEWGRVGLSLIKAFAAKLRRA